jgi:Ni,Fe-hydrogenase I large subunit
MHHVHIVDTRVAEYVIVAPTEWNFHEDGAFAQDMRGLVEKDESELRLLAQISALSLDPCVAYEVEIHNA